METRSGIVPPSRRIDIARFLEANGFAVAAVLVFVGLKYAVHRGLAMPGSSAVLGLALVAVSAVGIAAWRAKRA